MNLGAKLKYVGVEMMRKDARRNDTAEVGLFCGFRTRTHEEELLKLIILGLKDKPNDIRALNVEMYNIMTLLFHYGETKEMIVFKNTKDDQKQAYELIEAVFDQLKIEKAMLSNDPEIVDVTKYDEVPKEFFSPDETTKSMAGGTNNPVNYNNRNYNSDYQKKQEEKKKEEERQEKLRWTPFVIGRKDDKPALKDLNAIKKKIAQLSAGEYERELPQLGDPEEEEEKEKSGAKKIQGAVV